MPRLTPPAQRVHGGTASESVVTDEHRLQLLLGTQRLSWLCPRVFSTAYWRHVFLGPGLPDQMFDTGVLFLRAGPRTRTFSHMLVPYACTMCLYHMLGA